MSEVVSFSRSARECKKRHSSSLLLIGSTQLVSGRGLELRGGITEALKVPAGNRIRSAIDVMSALEH